MYLGQDAWGFVATATFDKDSKKVYATINGDVSFSIGDNVLLILNRSSFLAKVEAFETMGDGATVRLSFDDILGDFFWNSGSEKPVLLKGLSNSKELVKPFAIIDVAAVPTAAVLSALKEQIPSTNGVTFAQAVEMAGLNSSSQVTVKIDAGNPNTMFETFFADKVKAKISTKRLHFLSDKTRMGRVITSDQPVKLVSVFNYLQNMCHDIREQQDAFILYTVTVVDEKLNVLINKKPIKEVIRFKNNEEIGYRLKFASETLIQFSGTYTVIIEKETVTNTDYIGWTGSSGIPGQYTLYNKESPFEVKYAKKYDDNNPRLELAGISSRLIFDLDFLNNKLASFTVGDKTIYGNIKLNEENKVQFTKPANVSGLVWGKDLAAFQPSGKGLLTSLEQGSLAKDETLQLKVELNNLEYAWEYFKTLQATPTTSVLELLPQLGQLKVTNADVAAAKAGVTILTGIETLATGTVKWYNDYVEILVKNNSEETFNVFNSNGADEGFQEVGVARFLNAVVADVKETYQLELQNIINPTSASDYVVWSADFQVMGENYRMVIQNAEVKQTTSGTTYKFYYDQGILEQLFRVGNHDDVIVILTRTESQRTL